MRTRQRARMKFRPHGWPTSSVKEAVKAKSKEPESQSLRDSQANKCAINSASIDDMPSYITKASDMLEPDDETIMRSLGLNRDMVGDSNIYLQEMNEFADIQMYNRFLRGAESRQENCSQYQYNIQRYLAPFTEQIAPGSSRPYGRLYERGPPASVCRNMACSYNYDEASRNKSEKMLYLTPYQVYAICTNVMAQVLESPDELVSDINWKPIAKAAQLPEQLCEDFWWSFDIAHLRDDAQGYLVAANRRYYRKTDRMYYVELERRVRCLISINEDMEKGLRTMAEMGHS